MNFGKKNNLISFLFSNFSFIICLILFGLLLFKNPFSERTLIPNFEPYPDTFNYVVPAIHFFENKSFEISREGRNLTPGVPPLYSIFLIPVFLIYGDPRMFYFTNLGLAVASFSLFYLILKKLINNSWVVGFSLFLYVTNYFIYWYPTLAMAENLLLALFLLGVFLLTVKISSRRMFLAGLIPVSFYATKYAAAPLAVIFLGFYFLRIIAEKGNVRRNFLFFILSFSLSSILFFLYQYFAIGSNILKDLVGYIMSFFTHGILCGL